MNPETQDLNQATLHYLDVIYRLSQGGEPATTNVIAERLGVTPSGASIMLRRLARRKLVQLTPYKGATLTPQGIKVALRTIRRHRLLEVFLIQVMGFRWHEVDKHAHALETVIDQEFEDRIDEITGHPTRCPHGHVIPTRDGVMPAVPDVKLVIQPIGTAGVIRCIDTDKPEWLEYFGQLGLMPGASITLKSIAPYGGAVTVATSEQTITLGYPLAEVILIEPDRTGDTTPTQSA
ncbi:MAG: metal-dependent transcriptional regulator [Anaerolineae bacterium]|nr:metal-dependent transcriptional regulator [Thermoflexales bacterium]MDW8407373.1 metal-dependent transcriptional regulator [Anaerolineae bacterium]